jgi:ketosteroid isomerase-like protein
MSESGHGGQERAASGASERLELARQSYFAFARGDRQFFEDLLSDDFTFSSPPDPHLDRAGWFERCWPGAGRGQEFTFARVIAAGDEVIVTYDLRRPGGGGRNTEVLTFDQDDKVVRTEVYFGWNE